MEGKQNMVMKCKFRLIALLLSILLILTGCGKKGSGKGDSPSQSMRDPVTGEYAPMENASMLTGIFRAGETYRYDGERLISSTIPLYDPESGKLTTFSKYEEDIPVTDENGEPVYAIPDIQKTEYTSVTTLRTILPTGECISAIPLPMPENHAFSRGGITENGVWYLSYIYKRTDMLEQGNSGYALNCMNLDGSDHRSVPASEVFGNPTDDSAISGFHAAICPNGTLIVASGFELAILDRDLTRQYSVAAEDTIKDLSVLPDGRCLFLTGEIHAQRLWDLAEGDRQPVLRADLSELMGRVIFGAGADYYLMDNEGIRAVTGEESVPLLNRQNTALSSGVYVIGAVAPDVFAVIDVDIDNGMIILYRRAEDIDLALVKVLEVASALLNEDSTLQQKIIQYNREHPDMRVVLTDVVDHNAGKGEWYDRLCFNLGNGFYKPDIIIAQNGTKPVDVLIAKNLYRDLTPFLEKDEDIRLDDLFGMLRSYFTDENGGLWGISPSFYLRALTGRDDILGKYSEKGSWTLDEALDFLESRTGKTIGLDRLTQDNWSWWLLGPAGFNRWIDYDAGECHFDRADFARLLRYLNTLPKDFDDYIRHADFWAGMSDIERDLDYTPYQEGKIALISAWLAGVPSCYTLGEQFGTEESDTALSYIGFPTENGRDTLELRTESLCMITKSCSDPDAAWDFIRTLFDDPESLRGMNGEAAAVFGYHMFPALKSAYNRYTEVFDRYYMTETTKPGNPYPQTSVTYEERPKDGSDPVARNGKKVIVYEHDFLAEIRSLLDNAAVTPYVNYTPEEIEEIIFEEVSAYLGGGADADNCVKHIQSRVSIWLAEHK